MYVYLDEELHQSAVLDHSILRLEEGHQKNDDGRHVARRELVIAWEREEFKYGQFF